MKMADPNNQTTLGHFKLEEGQGLMIQFPRSDCLYTNIQLGNMWWESLDYANHQSHLNGFMTQVDSDGMIRYVVSRVDPGVPNWLDTEGRREGTMFLRWTHCAGPAPEAIETHVISIDEVRTRFPDDTPMITADARREALRRRPPRGPPPTPAARPSADARRWSSGATPEAPDTPARTATKRRSR